MTGNGQHQSVTRSPAVQILQAATLLQLWLQETPRHEDDDEFFEALSRTYVPTWSWTNLIVDEATGANVIAFSSGYGDGSYPSYWGHDLTGQRVALVTDFVVLDASRLTH
jgi:hypothetical protein